MGRVLSFAYGLFCYLTFLATYVYAVGFVGNLVVPNTLDGAPRSPFAWALFVNAMLLGLFAVQHSVMARKGFKQVWTKVVPKHLERSTYVLFSNIALWILFLYWEPIGGTIWSVENPMGRTILYTLFASGWLTVVGTSFLINHFDLFGVRQVWLHLRGKEYTHLPFATPGPYRYVRHPLYVGWLLAFWCTPTMTISHLAFALGTTLYILVAIRFEERDLVDLHGPSYAEYRNRTPMLVPSLTPKTVTQQPATAEGESSVA